MNEQIDIFEFVWSQLQTQINSLSGRIDDLEQRSERSETAGGIQSFTYADAPRNITNAMSDGQHYIDAAWISDGRKPTEGAGLGTGVLATFDAGVDDWLRIGDYSVVVI